MKRPYDRLAPVASQPASSPSRRRTSRGPKRRSPNIRQAARQSRYPAALARAGAVGGWLPQKAIEQSREMLGMAADPRLEVATFYTMFNLAPVGGNSCPGLRHDAVLAARRRTRSSRPASKRSASASGDVPRRRQVLLGGGRVPGRLRQRADGPDQRRLLRGPDRRDFEKLIDALAARRDAEAGLRRSTARARRPIGGPTTLDVRHCAPNMPGRSKAWRCSQRQGPHLHQSLRPPRLGPRRRARARRLGRHQGDPRQGPRLASSTR